MKPAFILRAALAVAAVPAFPLQANADAVVEWNARANTLVVESKLGTPPAIRVMALVQTAVHEAVSEVERGPGAARASLDAAVAAANRVTLTGLLPAQRDSTLAAYQAALKPIADGPAKDAGVAIGERAAAALLAARADDRVAAGDTYRPHTTAGAYVPTVQPLASQWPQRKPWRMTSASQFRPGPPPELNSETWVRDFNEVKALGGKSSAKRTAAQTEIARFWEYSLPPIYHGVVQSVAVAPGRDVVRNARLFAVVTQAMDDAMISVFDAKYHYRFWRPVTAIRNGDLDGNDGTERDGSWTPFIDTPMHPEYPCAHCILASTVGAVLEAEIGEDPRPVLRTASPTAKGAVRQWMGVNELVQEVADARIYDGVHYRTSTEIGVEMGRRIGQWAASTQP